ncbi:hypothetical protein Tco_1074256 [Tanacetum coccineum]
MAAEVPQTLLYRGGQLNVAPLLEEFQDSPNNEEDTRSSQEYINDFEIELHERYFLAKSKRFFIKGTQRFCGVKAIDQSECHKCGRKGHFVRNQGLVAKAYEWDEKEVSSDAMKCSGQKDLAFVKSLADDTKVSIPNVERPWLSKTEGFNLPNHETGRSL